MKKYSSFRETINIQMNKKSAMLIINKQHHLNNYGENPGLGKYMK